MWANEKDLIESLTEWDRNAPTYTERYKITLGNLTEEEVDKVRILINKLHDRRRRIWN